MKKLDHVVREGRKVSLVFTDGSVGGVRIHETVRTAVVDAALCAGTKPVVVKS